MSTSERRWPDLRDWPGDMLYDWFYRARYALWRATCRLFGHDWCEWEPMESNRRAWEYRVCNRCCELEERNERVIPEDERTVRVTRGREPFDGYA